MKLGRHDLLVLCLACWVDVLFMDWNTAWESEFDLFAWRILVSSEEDGCRPYWYAVGVESL
jgi:hypothetical protein